MRVPFISCALVLAVAACGAGGPVDDKANNTAGLPDVAVTAPSVAGEPHVKTVPGEGSSIPAMKIPAAFHGRWGLTPGDCTTALGDAKGMLVINEGEMRFYESRAVPAADVASDGHSMSGNFGFSGEGQSWTKYESLRLDKGVLTRTETKPTASFSYAKCS